MEAAEKVRLPIFVVDDSKNESVTAALLERKAIVSEQVSPGMGASRRQAIRAGLDSEADIVVWLEPEKHTLVPLLKSVINQMQDGFDLIVPCRHGLETYPQYQELSELRANREIGFITGRPELDLMFGPRVMGRTYAKISAEYTGAPGNDNWEILFVPVLSAIKRGLKIGSQIVEYDHPHEQKELEDTEAMRAKRDKQRLDITTTMSIEAHRLGIARVR